MRTDPMGKFCHPEKRSVVGQCEGVCRSIAFVRDDALYGKSKTPSEETLTGFWCPGQESNLHASRHTHLKRARLPIPPPGHIPPKDTDGAKNGTRTRDPNLGKVVLYQLSYFRNCECKDSFTFRFMQMVYYFFSSNKLLQNN